jgi:hypothetical protein
MLDLLITGREVSWGLSFVDEDLQRLPDGSYPVHTTEYNIVWWRGWDHEPLSDYVAANFESCGHAGYENDGSYFFLDEDDLDKLLTDFASNGLAHYVPEFEAARTWLTEPGKDRKIYFEINC